MTIWDRGRYLIPKDKDGSQGVQDGKLELTLYGKNLRGEWHLVRTKSGKDEWLISRRRTVTRGRKRTLFLFLT